MRIGFVVNDLKTEEPGYTTTRLAIAAKERGHEPWIMSVGDFAWDPDDHLRARAHSPSKSKFKDGKEYLADINGAKAKVERITLDELDVLMLRNDPASDVSRPWAQTSGIIFGQLAAACGVIVVNDPNALADAINKMYFQRFPEEVRPRTLITRDREDVARFIEQEKGNVVLKPLQGSGGASVFLVKNGDKANVNQMIDAIIRDGYLIAQEYLPQAAQGDVRLFMMNGQPLVHKGHYAAFRRVSRKGDMRSNLHAGGEIEKVEVTDEMLHVAEMVRPKLVEDGMFLVGLDIVGDKLMEVNVFSPGGLGSAQKMEKNIPFTQAVIEALERKVEYRKYGQGRVDNRTLATL